MRYSLFGLNKEVRCEGKFAWFAKIVYDYHEWTDGENMVEDFINIHSTGDKWIDGYKIKFGELMYETDFV